MQTIRFKGLDEQELTVRLEVPSKNRIHVFRISSGREAFHMEISNAKG